MRAVVQRAYGPPQQVLSVEDVDEPEVGHDEVLIRVRAAGIDPGVLHLVTGLPYLVRLSDYGLRSPRRPTPGRDVAGEVERVGRDVLAFEPGEEVFGTCEGGYAELARASPDELVVKPRSVSFEQAAAVPTSAMTALQALRDAADLREEEHVLIIGAGGGVGSFAVQIACALGAWVTGSCSGAKVGLVRALGADHVIDYTSDQLDRFGPYDAVVDVAGRRPISQLRRLLTRKGRLVIVGGEGGGRIIGGVQRQVRAMLTSPFVSHTLRPIIARPNRSDLLILRTLLGSQGLSPVLDGRHHLEEVPEVLGRLEHGHARGKTVISL